MSARPYITAGDRTRSLILDHIRSAGQISRVELAHASSFDQATISHVVRRLLADELVVETGYSPSKGGKPRTLLAINAPARFAVGVSLDHEQLTVVVTDLAGRLVDQLVSAGAGDAAPGDVLARIAAEVDSLLSAADVPLRAVVGIGLASPGPLDSVAGALRGEQPTPAWRNFPLEEFLEERTGMRVVLDNDATCAALGEHWTSQAAPAAVSATVYMADGIGCGILVNGGVFHGTSSNPGELGHITLDVNGPVCGCGSRGCVELYATPAAVVTKALADDALSQELGLHAADRNSRANFARIAQAAVRGHEPSYRLVAEAARHLGEGVVTLCNLLDIDEVHLSGPGFHDAGAIFSQVIQERVDRGTFMRAIHPVTVTLSHVGTEAAALGAAALILQQEMTPHLTMASRRRPRDRPPRRNARLVAADARR